MRREDIQLRLLAKQGDAKAQIKIGAAYLKGTPHIAKNLPIGIDYLRAAFKNEAVNASICISNSLALEDIIKYGQEDALLIAAQHNDNSRIKIAIWRLIRGDFSEAINHITKCKKSIINDIGGDEFIGICNNSSLLRVLLGFAQIDISKVIECELFLSLKNNNTKTAVHILAMLSSENYRLSPTAKILLANVIERAEIENIDISSIRVGLIEDGMNFVSLSGNPYACYTLGRAYAGIDCGGIDAEQITDSQNMRKAAALLMRAADFGIPDAWLQLFRICSDYRSSVANPSMARFCLEKAAQHRIAEAERRLGALVLKDATHIDDMEKGVELLYRAARKGDALAVQLLRSLVVPVQAHEGAAQAAIDAIQQTAPILAARLRVARAFGLTKLEALTANPAVGRRPWGLLVCRNPFVSKMRLSEPRVIPAADIASMECLEQAAIIFSSNRDEGTTLEGSLRARVQQLTRFLQKLELSEDHFFSKFSSNQRDTLRIGTKWAQKQKDILQRALT